MIDGGSCHLVGPVHLEFFPFVAHVSWVGSALEGKSNPSHHLLTVGEELLLRGTIVNGAKYC